MSKTIIPEYMQFDYPRLLLQFSQLSTATKQLIRKYQIAKATAVSLKETVTRLTSELASEKSKVQNLESELADKARELEEERNRIKDIEIKLNSVKEALDTSDKVTEELKTLKAKLAEKDTTLLKLEARIKELTDKLATKQVELDKLMLTKNKPDNAQAFQTEKITRLEAQIKSLQQRIKELSEQSVSLEKLNLLYKDMQDLARDLDRAPAKKVDPSEAVDINSTDWAKFVDGSLV